MRKKINYEKIDKEIFRLKEEGKTYQEIVDALGISTTTVVNRCKKIYMQKGKEIPKAFSKKLDEKDKMIIKLRESGLTYEQIGEKLGITSQAVEQRLRKICRILKIDRIVIIKEEELKEKIYELREQGLSHKKIADELKVKKDYVDRKCKEIYEKNGIDEIEHKNEIINKKIYELREQGLSRTEVAKRVGLGIQAVNRKCKEIYEKLGKEEPILDRGCKAASKITSSDEKIYNLKEQGYTNQEIADELEINVVTVSKKCNRIYSLKGKKVPKVKSGVRVDLELEEEIYDMRIQGATYKEIVSYCENKGKKLSMTSAKNKYIKVKNSEQELAKAIINLIKTKNASLEQIQVLANYYGIDLNRTFDSLEER